jgi:hypothetical protein
MLSRPGVRPGKHPRLGGIIDSAGLVDGGCAAQPGAVPAGHRRIAIWCSAAWMGLRWTGGSRSGPR